MTLPQDNGSRQASRRSFLRATGGLALAGSWGHTGVSGTPFALCRPSKKASKWRPDLLDSESVPGISSAMRLRSTGGKDLPGRAACARAGPAEELPLPAVSPIVVHEGRPHSPVPVPGRDDGLLQLRRIGNLASVHDPGPLSGREGGPACPTTETFVTGLLTKPGADGQGW